ncbi:uncharacterized protein LOC117586232 [Drosophila guanche]|uniref:Tubulin-specific chaperone A n=1 Tax=Drosophila guanche TaxID=7266 RepID=A0A3B0JPG9_DROGU|nr:uncharacterized protein LOC117586232 [Drosophila guanche]SPP84114.1 Hypothetical predicted protein [Drosophila guanche]
MENPRKSDLKKLTNAISFLQKHKDSHEQQVIVEEGKLAEQSLAANDASHKKIDQMDKVQELHWMFSQDYHELKLLSETLQTFLDMNQDMKDTEFYRAATQYIGEHCNESELEPSPQILK